MSKLRLAHSAPPASPPAANTGVVFMDTDGALQTLQSDGSQFRVGAGLTPTTIPAGMVFPVPADYQMLLHGSLILAGTLALSGDLVLL